jgi:hypothetical protein
MGDELHAADSKELYRHLKHLGTSEVCTGQSGIWNDSARARRRHPLILGWIIFRCLRAAARSRLQEGQHNPMWAVYEFMIRQKFHGCILYLQRPGTDTT